MPRPQEACTESSVSLIILSVLLYIAYMQYAAITFEEALSGLEPEVSRLILAARSPSLY